MPDPALQTTALRYAAGDLTAAEAAAFEVRLATDQDARDALGEAVRLSAAALGQAPPAPDRTFREAIRERLLGWYPGWLARRAYRGHPLAWAGLGAAAVAACTVFALSVADPEPDPAAPPAVAVAPAPRQAAPEPVALAPIPREAESFVPVVHAEPAGESVAELWAQMSGTETVEKAHDDEMKWRQKFRDAGAFSPPRVATDAEPREP